MCMLNVIHLMFVYTGEMLLVCLNHVILIHSCCVVCCLQNLCSGTTAVVGMVTYLHLHMGWVGDSQSEEVSLHLHHNHINLKDR